MKHIRKFESYRNNKRRDEIIKESVLQVNDIYKVRTLIDIPQSLINAYVKKVKDNTGKNLRQFFGDVDIAEEIVKYVTLNFTNVDQVPAGALTGDAQGSPEGQTQAQSQTEPQAQTQAQPQTQTQAQPQAQTQSQGQAQVQVQTEAEPQAQPQAQTQGQAQVQGQGEFEEVGEEEKEGTEEEPQGQAQEEGEEELPL